MWLSLILGLVARMPADCEHVKATGAAVLLMAAWDYGSHCCAALLGMCPLLSQTGRCLLKPFAHGSAHRSWLARLSQLLSTPQQQHCKG